MSSNPDVDEKAMFIALTARVAVFASEIHLFARGADVCPACVLMIAASMLRTAAGGSAHAEEEIDAFSDAETAFSRTPGNA